MWKLALRGHLKTDSQARGSDSERFGHENGAL